MRGILLAGCALILPCTAISTTIHVFPDGSGDYPTIQAAVSAAAAGDMVEVACGTYHEHDIKLRDQVVLRSETGLAGCAIVDADHLGRVILSEPGGVTSVVSGIDLINGTAGQGAFPNNCGGGAYLSHSHVTFENCIFRRNDATNCGGALYSDWSELTLVDCQFAENRALYGGAVFLFGQSPCTGVRCVFRNNLATSVAGGVYVDNAANTWSSCLFDANNAGAGGGIGSSFAPTQCHDCVFQDNIAAAGGGVSFEGGSFLLEECTFTGNETTDDLAGGAAVRVWGANGAVHACRMIGNVAHGRGGAVETQGQNAVLQLLQSQIIGNAAGNHGGGVYGIWSELLIDGCTIASNSATGDGGGVAVYQTPTTVRATVLANNVSGARGGGCRFREDDATLSNCTFYANAAAHGSGFSLGYGVSCSMTGTIIAFAPSAGAVECQGANQLTVECCDIFGNGGGDWTGCLTGLNGTAGNLSADPLFCDVASGDWRLQESSPCAAPHSGGCGLIGALDVGCGVVSVEPESWGRIKNLFR